MCRPLSVSLNSVNTGERVIPSRRLTSRDVFFKYRPVTTKTPIMGRYDTPTHTEAEAQTARQATKIAVLWNRSWYCCGRFESTWSRSFEKQFKMRPTGVTSK